MAEDYNTSRLQLFGGLLEDEDIREGRPWLIGPESLRLAHGTTLAELRVPFHVGAEDETCLEEAIAALSLLLKKRYERADETAKAGPVDGPSASLRERTCRLDIFVEGSFERALAERTLATTPYIDSAILYSWLAPGGPGKRFIDWTRAIFEKALKEEARIRGSERTSYVTLLALLKVIRKKRNLIKDIRIKGLNYDRHDLATGLTLFNALSFTLERLLKDLEYGAVHYYNPDTERVLLSATVPVYFLSIPTNLLAQGLNPYGMDSATFKTLDPLYVEPEASSGLKEAMDIMASRLARDASALEAARRLQRMTRFREAALRFMMDFDVPEALRDSRLYEIYNDDRLVTSCLEEKEAARDLTGWIEDVRKTLERDARRKTVVEDFQEAFSSLKKKKGALSGLFGGRKKEAAETLAPVIRAFYARKLDALAESFIDTAMDCLIDRRGELKDAVLREEYMKGRLYRFSTDTRPVLKAFDVKEEGQLFVDMKDFTRRTSKIKEVAMADFMKEYFYLPILKAAGRYGAGRGLSEDESGLRLTNIPGDAAIFSGGVANLVSLARDIQRIIRESRKQLARKLPPRKDEEILEKVHRKFEEKREALRRRRLEITAELGKKKPGLEAKLIAIGEEESRLEAVYKEELQAAIKCELEAGLFISYGTKAETIVFENVEGLYGPVEVSIGEKINEASRGTFRHPMVRANLEILLSEEKKKRRNNSIVYPFDVYIHTTYALRMPPELEKAFERLVTNRKLSNAEALARIITENYLSDFRKVVSGEPFSSLRLITSVTDIYNRGQALSGEALEAYMTETRGVKRFFRKTVRAEDLHRSIGEKFFFPSKELEFIVGTASVKGAPVIEVFHKSGELIFRGFETSSPTTVWELVDPEGEFYKLLLEHHYRGWFDEAAGSFL